jgi:cell division septation protein DedD
MNLSLDKKSLGCTAVGFLLIGGLLFLAGFLVAMRLYRSPEGSLESSAADRGQQRFTVPRALKPRFRAPRPPSAAPVGQARGIANRLAAGTAPGAAKGPSNKDATPPPTGEPSSKTGVAAASESGEGPDTPDSPPAEPVVYSVQVGAFLRDSDVNPLLRDLEDMGFAPFVVKDSEGRLLSVRIGKFETREEAVMLAEEFTAQTGRSAVVRPPPAR